MADRGSLFIGITMILFNWIRFAVILTSILFLKLSFISKSSLMSEYVRFDSMHRQLLFALRMEYANLTAESEI